MPALEELHKRYQGKPFTILTIDVGESAAKVKKFIAKEGYSFKILLDEKSSVSEQYKITKHPVGILIDEQGNQMALAFGYREWNAKAMLDLIDGLIAGISEDKKTEQISGSTAQRALK